MCLINGKGCPKDREEGLYWVRLIVDTQCRRAVRYLKKLQQEKTNQEKRSNTQEKSRGLEVLDPTPLARETEQRYADVDFSLPRGTVPIYRTNKKQPNPRQTG